MAAFKLRLAIGFLVIGIGLANFASSSAQAQLIYTNDFSHYDETETYTKAMWEADWLDPVWEDGIREGRVSIITGSQAYRRRDASMIVDFPAGSVGPKEGGAQWKFDFGVPAQMVRVKYRVKFGRGFDFVRGGKLPGLAGGTAPTGSTQADGSNGFAARVMWRTDHDGAPGDPVQTKARLVQYVKHPFSGFDGDGRQEDNLPYTNSDGEPFEVESGRWYRITQLVKLNDIGRTNGRILVWINGRNVLDSKGMYFRNTTDLGVNVFYFTTFFGGSKSTWAASKDEQISFDDFEIEIRKL